MSAHVNAYGQPVGPDMSGWSSRPRPPRTPMEGRTCRVVPLNAEAHAAGLFATYSAAPDRRSWTYLPDEMPEREAELRDRLEARAASQDPLFHTILARGGDVPLGLAAYLRIDPANGVIEVGHLNFGPSLQRKPAATEAMALMMTRAFDELGYRRYEWKCDSLNAPSRAAALRLGFTFEGIFRNATVVKGRSRDTAWFSITDAEWPEVRAGFAAWLDPENFDPQGRQRRGLTELRAAVA